MRRLDPRWLLACAAALLVNAPELAGALECGDEVRQSVRLTADVGPCGQAITVVGPAVLDLNGHTVHCDREALSDGVVLTGRRARLLRGVVRGCGLDGVEIAGTGRHRIEGVLSIDNGNDGFSIKRGSDGNELLGNVAAGNVAGGIELGPSRSQRVLGNISIGNGSGFRVFFEGVDHVLAGNTATANGAEGFDVDSDTERVTFEENVAVDNGREGFLLYGARHRVLKNRVLANGENGFTFFATGSLVRGNLAFGNAGVDFEGDDEVCSTNRLRDNVLGTSAPACVE